jgi:hypothetical protein
MNKKNILILGDILAIAVLTIIGFATHGEAGISFVPRMGTTFFPVLVGWFLLAPWFGLFDENITANTRFLWRVPLVMLFAAPFATVMRAAMFGSAALPLFTLILGSTFALGLLIWRAVYGFVLKRRPDLDP